MGRGRLLTLVDHGERNGKRQRAVRAKFFGDAPGSGKELRGCPDGVGGEGVFEAERVQEGKELLLRVVSMLTKLVNMYSSEDHLKEQQVEYPADEPPQI